MTKTLTHLVRAGAAVAALTVAGAANAALVFTPNGDPFPAGSEVTLTPNNGPFETPYGWVGEIVLRDFAANALPFPDTSTSVGNQIYTYAATFNNVFFSDNTLSTQVGTYQGTTSAFSVQVNGRLGLQTEGTFNATLLEATFGGTAYSSLAPNGTDGPLFTQIDPSVTTSGTVTFGPLTIVGGNLGQYVSSDFSVPGQFATDLSGPFVNVPMTGTSNPAQPPAQVPLPATLALLLPGLLGVIGLRRRKAIAA